MHVSLYDVGALTVHACSCRLVMAASAVCGRLEQGHGVGDGAREERGVGHQQPHLRLLDAQPHQGVCVCVCDGV